MKSLSPTNIVKSLSPTKSVPTNIVKSLCTSQNCPTKLSQKFPTKLSQQNCPGAFLWWVCCFICISNTLRTRLFHHLDFLKQAEGYRRVFIKTLNDEYAFGGSKTGERGWKADTAFFQSVKDFTYKKPALVELLSKYRIDALVLFFWLVASLLLLYTSSKKASVL